MGSIQCDIDEIILTIHISDYNSVLNVIRVNYGFKDERIVRIVLTEEYFKTILDLNKGVKKLIFGNLTKCKQYRISKPDNWKFNRVSSRDILKDLNHKWLTELVIKFENLEKTDRFLDFLIGKVRVNPKIYKEIKF